MAVRPSQYNFLIGIIIEPKPVFFINGRNYKRCMVGCMMFSDYVVLLKQTEEVNERLKGW